MTVYTFEIHNLNFLTWNKSVILLVIDREWKFAEKKKAAEFQKVLTQSADCIYFSCKMKFSRNCEKFVDY